MKGRPLISIIIPCYNHGHYLDRALESVLAQTMPDWEVIVVDDGSTDDTRAVVRAYADGRVRYLYQENQGLAGARNTGIDHARGNYLAFLDADDEWEPPFLERCVAVLEADDSLAGVYTRVTFIDEDGRRLLRLGAQPATRASFRERLLQGGFFPPSSVLVRRETVEMVGRFDPDLTSLEDWDLWLRLSEEHEMEGIPDPLARYRVSPGSMSTNVARIYRNQMVILDKYFGPAEGDATSWSQQKRQVYGFAYRMSALGYLEQGEADAGWRLLKRAFAVYPPLLERLDTFYELICGEQPKGVRGEVNLLDVDGRVQMIERRLASLFEGGSQQVSGRKRAAYANVYLAASMLNDQAGRWNHARRYLLRTLWNRPALLRSASVVRRLLKLLAGKRLAQFGRSVWKGDEASSMQQGSVH